MGNGNKAAYPLPTVMRNNRELHQPGMTLREYYAGLALQGLLTGPDDISRRTFEEIVARYAELAVQYADALLKALEASQ